MGLLDDYRAKLKGLLGGMPITQMAQGRAEVSPQGLLGALKAMPIGPDASGAYEAAMSVGPLMAGMTKWEKAHKVAQKNAALPVEKGGLGLPKNNTAADRAKAMGFGGEVYHGGTNDFSGFKVSDRSNVYASDNPSIADIYAAAQGRHRALREVNAEPNVIPLTYRGRLLEVSDQGPTGGGWYIDNLAAAIGADPSRGLVKKLPSHGYAGAKITEMDDLGGRQSQYVFPDPSVLRSRFAAFDPKRKHENDLLAAYFGIPLGQDE